MIARHLSNIQPSPTLALNQKAAEMKSAGVNVLSLSAGEPDFNTPKNIIVAAEKAMQDGKTKYTPVGGIQELKKSILDKYKKEKNLEYKTSEVIISAGAKQSIFNAFQASLDEGDEVLIITPYWVSYPDMVKLAKAVPIFVENKNMQVDLKDLRDKISAKTKWIIINSPNNPSGKVISEDVLKQMADIFRDNSHLSILSDDIYEEIFYEKKPLNILDVAPDLKSRVLIVNGVSKSCAMTGWRIGYALGPQNLIKAMSIIQSQSTSNPCSVSQYAAVEAINNSEEFIRNTLVKYHSRRKLFLELISHVDGLECASPEGAFYMFVDCKGIVGKKTDKGDTIKDDFDFCKYLLEEGNLVVVPGSVFGAKNFVRASYVVSEDVIKNALSVLKELCNRLV